jgi:hypothetical protein
MKRLAGIGCNFQLVVQRYGILDSQWTLSCRRNSIVEGLQGSMLIVSEPEARVRCSLRSSSLLRL